MFLPHFTDAILEICKFHHCGPIFFLGNMQKLKKDTHRNILVPIKKSSQGGAWDPVVNAKLLGEISKVGMMCSALTVAFRAER